jgi:N-formylglutamate deformylase
LLHHKRNDHKHLGIEKTPVSAWKLPFLSRQDACATPWDWTGMTEDRPKARAEVRGWTVDAGRGPLVATAIHDGHELRPELAALCALSSSERLREEDPWTAEWTTVAPSRVVVRRSRFEVDMNRPREGSVYRTPEEAWGLRVWKEPLPAAALARSWQQHDAFYADVRRLLDGISLEHDRFVVFDLHSYNHRRGGPGAPPDDPAGNPDVNLGTGSMDRGLWGAAADAFLETMAGERIGGRTLDVRENVRFKGGWFSRWVHETYPGRGCALAIEIKKIFMDEWTGVAEPGLLAEMGAALGRAAGAVHATLVGPPHASALAAEVEAR